MVAVSLRKVYLIKRGIYFPSNQPCFIIITASPPLTNEGMPLSHMKVTSAYKEKVPRHLIIDSCNLKLNESVGQGDIVNVVSYVL